MKHIENILGGSDLRSLGRTNEVVASTHTKQDFDYLFTFLYNSRNEIVMRVADALEKLSRNNLSLLKGHEEDILNLCHHCTQKTLKWHLAQMLPRLELDDRRDAEARRILKDWACDRSNSRIVRVNSLQSLYELEKDRPFIHDELLGMMNQLENEGIPSLNARIRKLSKLINP